MSNKNLELCMYLRKVSTNFRPQDAIDGNSVFPDAYNESPYSYYCKLTIKKCVGAKDGLLIGLNDKLDKAIVERCPSRKNVENI